MRRNMSKGSRQLRKTITVQQINEQTYQFIVNENELNDQMRGAEQVLADSDNFAFIYLVDVGDAYVYLRIEKQHWPQLAKVMEQQLTVTDGQTTLTLPGFTEQFIALLYNIEGNDNYGEAFVTEVEATFADVLQ